MTATDPPETGTETDPPETGTETPPATGKLPDDHPAAIALREANAEAAKLRRKVKEFEDQGKTEIERATAAEAEATRRADAAELRVARLEVGLEKGLTPAQARRLVGTTREELESDADEFVKDLGKGGSSSTAENGDGPPARKPTEKNLGGGAGGDAAASDDDVEKIVASIPRY